MQLLANDAARLKQLELLGKCGYQAAITSQSRREVETRAIEVPTVFEDFEDYWSPFLGGQAPAPGYCMSLSEERRSALREFIRTSLPILANGSIHLIARAWAVRGIIS
jgi:hypothetical protein